MYRFRTTDSILSNSKHFANIQQFYELIPSESATLIENRLFFSSDFIDFNLCEWHEIALITNQIVHLMTFFDLDDEGCDDLTQLLIDNFFNQKVWWRYIDAIS